MNLKERLTKQYAAEREAGHAAVEADFKRKMDALAVVWSSLQGQSIGSTKPQTSTVLPLRTPAPSPTAAAPAPTTDAATRPRLKRIMGITQAVDEVTANITGRFSPEDIHDKVAAMFPDREVKRQSITDSLWRLEQDHKVRVIVHGRGKRKGQYERIKPSSVTQNMQHGELTM